MSYRDNKCPRVAIIILNWNGWKDTIECLESVLTLTYPNYRIIVVDNGSTDNSVERIKEWCERKIAVRSDIVKYFADRKPIKFVEYDLKSDKTQLGDDLEQENKGESIIIIQNSDNIGFSAGNNVAIKYAMKNDFPYVWLLNNDTVVDESALTELINVAEKEEKAGILGSLIYSYYKPDRILGCGSNKLLWLNKKIKISKYLSQSSMTYFNVKWLGGASLLVKKNCINVIGLLDENFFFTMEDTDWCVRTLKSGRQNLCCFQSKIWHKCGLLKISENHKFLGKEVIRLPLEKFTTVGYYEIRNRIYFSRKNFPRSFPFYLFFRTGSLIIKILIYDNHKKERIRLVLKATKEGVQRKMGPLF